MLHLWRTRREREKHLCGLEETGRLSRPQVDRIEHKRDLDSDVLSSTKCNMAPPPITPSAMSHAERRSPGLERLDALSNLPFTTRHAQRGTRRSVRCAILVGPGFETTHALTCVPPQTATACTPCSTHEGHDGTGTVPERHLRYRHRQGAGTVWHFIKVLRLKRARNPSNLMRGYC